VVAAPLPALNEPHYLAKAKHYWNPAWCAGDLFLESANAHTVFYAAVGWLTLFLPLEAVAWIGRVTSLTLLATGWTAFTRRLIPQPGAAFLAAWLFLGLQAVGNWSGEWVIGGVESKVYAFAALFWAAAWGLDGKPLRAAAACGVGISFHPVVGLWTLLAVMGAALVGWAVPTTTSLDAAVGTAHPTKRWLALGILILTALPGLIPVVQLLTASVDPMTRYAGTYLQVYHRLAHHLDPMQYPGRIEFLHRQWASGDVGYLGLGLLWLIGVRFGPRTASWRWLHGVMLWAVLFAVVGVLVGYGPRPPQLMPGYAWRMHLLKFYPFRLADALLPMVIAWLTAWCVNRLSCVPSSPLAPIFGGEGRGEGASARVTLPTDAVPNGIRGEAPGPLTLALSPKDGGEGTDPKAGAAHRATRLSVRTVWPHAMMAVVLGGLIAATLWRGGSLAQSERYQASQDADWIDACHWIRDRTPVGSVFQTPHFRWTFKWYAERPEYATFKDCPQDPPSIVEWNHRLQLLTKRFQTGFADGVYTWEELQALRHETGITHIITDRLGPMGFPPVYQNETFRVYDLTGAVASPLP